MSTGWQGRAGQVAGQVAGHDRAGGRAGGRAWQYRKVQQHSPLHWLEYLIPAFLVNSLK